MSIRKAFVGLSGPLFFDYQNSAPRSAEDLYSSPNPILDSPAALILLYDEIWFLSKSLCPASMRTLPFVRFLLEEPDALVMLSDFSFDDVANDDLLDELKSYFTRKEFFDKYDANVFNTGASWWRTKGSAIDNHNHGINLTKIGINAKTANSTDPGCVFFDQALINHLGGDFELAVNAFIQQVVFPSSRDSTLNAVSLTEEVSLVDALTFSSLPTRLTTGGPDVDFLGELREHGCLLEFRKWVKTYSSRISEKELRDVESDVEAAIDQHIINHFKKYEPKSFSLSTCKTILAEGIGFAVPGFSQVLTSAKTHRDWREIKAGRWSAFLGNARQLAKKKKYK